MTTVEAFLEKENLPESISGGTLNYAMIEFAKLHVEAALKAASEKATSYVSTNGEWTSSNVDSKVNKGSILNAYPLENIK